MTPADYDEVVRGLYQAATGGMTWHEALQALTDGFGGEFCQLVAFEKATGRLAVALHSTKSSTEGVLDYLREYHRIDPHVAHAASLPPGSVLNSAKLIPAREASKHRFYQDFWTVHNIRYLSGGKVSDTDEMVVFCGVARNADAGAFTPALDATLSRVFGHLREAFAIYRRYSRLAAHAESGQMVMDQTARPILLLAPDRHVLHANPAARKLLHQAEVIVSRSGYLGCRDPRAEDALTRALYELELEGQPANEGKARKERSAFALRNIDGNPVPACIWAMRPADTMGAFGNTPRALLMLPTEILATEPDPMVLEAGFDLTPAEGRLLACLAMEMDVAKVAQVLGISVHTARAHLRNIFVKTGVRSQKELLQRVQSLTAL